MSSFYNLILGKKIKDKKIEKEKEKEKIKPYSYIDKLIKLKKSKLKLNGTEVKDKSFKSNNKKILLPPNIDNNKINQEAVVINGDEDYIVDPQDMNDLRKGLKHKTIRYFRK